VEGFRDRKVCPCKEDSQLSPTTPQNDRSSDALPIIPYTSSRSAVLKSGSILYGKCPHIVQVLISSELQEGLLEREEGGVNPPFRRKRSREADSRTRRPPNVEVETRLRVATRVPYRTY
jgi:hypothetical protein